MFRISTHRKDQARFLRVALTVIIATMMVISSMMPAYYSFAEDEAKEETKTQTTVETKAEEPKKEEPKEEAPPAKTQEPVQASDDQTPSGGSDQEEVQDPDPEPKATEDSQIKSQGDQSSDTRGTTTDLEDPAEPTEVIEENKEDDEAMPAQTFSGSAGGVKVKASAGKGVFPKGTKMKVSSVSSSYVISAASGLAGKDSEVVDGAAVDITFFSEGKEVQPAEGSVGVSLSSGAIDGDVHEAVHISGGSASIIGGASSGHAFFNASHFSIYGIIGVDYEDPDVDKYARYTYIFKVNGQEVDRQIVRNGEEVTAPEDPENKWFKGWDVDGKITNFPLTASIPEDETEDRNILVEAAFEEVCKATFYKYEDSTNSILQVMEEKKGTVISTAGVNFEYDNGSAIVGWKEKGTNNAVSQLKLDRDYDLVPIISTEPLQVTFVTGEGTPIAPVFVDKGQKVKAPVEPTRSGYEFKGWFTDEACTKAYDFDEAVNEALTLYAGWEGARTGYEVVYWKQNANDDNYTFVEVETRTGNAGTAATYGSKNYTGFTLNAAKSNAVVFIKGDGTTIKNVYYDRNVYPLSFKKLQNNRWVDAGTKYFKYEQDTSEYWNQITANNVGYKWYVNQTYSVFGSNPFYSYAPPMKPANGNMTGFNGITAYGRTAKGSYTISYIEDGTNKKIHPDFSGTGEADTFTDEDHIIIPGFTFKREGEFSKGKGNLYYTRNTYAMKFVTNGGPAVSIISGIKYEASLATYDPSGYTTGVTTKVDNGITYTFEGWYNNEAFAGAPFDFNSRMPALEAVKQSGDKATLVLYAKWIADEHTVSFDLDGGTYDGSDSIQSQTVESGKLATAPDSSKMKKEGVAFAYWMDNAGNRFSFDTRITGDCTLKARWNSDNSRILKVVYDAVEGSGAPADDTRYQEGSMAVIKGQPTPPEGKSFIGWQVGKSSLVIAGGSFQLKSEDATDGDVTLTARYADKASRLTSVTYNANGGTIKGNTTYTDGSTVVNDDYKIISDVPVWENHNFLGWSTDANATKPMFKAGETVAVGNDARLRKTGNDLYAVWKMIPEKVTVFIIGNSDTVTFDGEEHKVEGYKVNSTNESYTENDFVFNGNAVASGTEEGTYNMGLKASMFENRNEKFEVLFEVEDGVLEIKKTDVLPDHEDEQFDEEENEEDFDGNRNGDEKKQKSYVKGAEDEPDSYVKGKTADVKNTDTNASNRGDSDGSVVRTGDDNPLPLLILLMLMTIAMTTAVVIRFRSSAKV